MSQPILKLWAVVWIQVQTPTMIDIRQIIDIVECSTDNMNQVYQEYGSNYNVQPIRQITWFLRQPPYPWEVK